MKTIQKVIKIGSSYGVTLPKKQLEAQGIAPGAEVEVSVVLKKDPQDSLVKEYEDFVGQYGETLKNLANR